jgi:hypothetical protein
MVNWSGYIRTETLSVDLNAGPPDPAAYSETLQVEGEKVLVGIQRVKI